MYDYENKIERGWGRSHNSLS